MDLCVDSPRMKGTVNGLWERRTPSTAKIKPSIEPSEPFRPLSQHLQSSISFAKNELTSFRSILVSIDISLHIFKFVIRPNQHNMEISDANAATSQDAVFDTENFFALTSTTREACNAKARELFGGQIGTVAFPFACSYNAYTCSYNVYAGHALELVVQFRLASKPLSTENSRIARKILGSLVSEVSFVGTLGEEGADKQQVHIYVTNRVHGDPADGVSGGVVGRVHVGNCWHRWSG